jgi:hypothetical protein
MRYVADLEGVDRQFVHIARIVHDLGGWHELTRMVERPSAERSLPPVRPRGPDGQPMKESRASIESS